MIDFVVVSSDLRPYVLDTRTWQTQTYCEGLLGTSGRVPLSGRSSTPTSGRDSHRFRGRLGTLSPSGPCSLPPLSTQAVRSCGRKVSGACCGGNPRNPVVDTGSKGCCQAEEGVLSGPCWPVGLLTQLTGTGRPSKPQPGRSWRQKLGSGRSSVRPWRRTIGRPRRDSGKPSGTSGRGKQYSANTVYSAGGELLTSTGDIVGRWKKYFEDLLNPTDLPSSEEAEAGDSERDHTSQPPWEGLVDLRIREEQCGFRPGRGTLDQLYTRWRDYVSQLAWERLGVPPEELEEVSGVREVWASLLRLLPPCDPALDQADEDGWMDLEVVLQAPGRKVLNKSSVLSVVPICDEANNSRLG
ncbi:hypothetical protein L3Q82_017276 [Scortum barcoo]|uniref:Uncharacterized protein n=1 Tax=Scortum barcoo TaxID=214431 RepID=A0ACB8VL51_9TELE|nr:hypothetical protein L3Q82_017276 [Scortum barcoo]